MMKTVRKLVLIAICGMLMPFGAGQTLKIHGAEEKRDVNVFSLYNPWSGEHFYTTDEYEYVVMAKNGWAANRTAWMAAGQGSRPVYRLYNAFNGDHYYTADRTEYRLLEETGWNGEGIVFYSDDNHTVPVYRMFNPYAETGTHYFTASEKECELLAQEGWISEGIVWYGTGVTDEAAAVPENGVVQTKSFRSSHELVSQGDGYSSYSLPFERDGMKIYGEMFLPEEEKSSYPTVIIGHGFNSSYVVTSDFAKEFAKAGIAAYVFDFIGGSTYSRSDGQITDMSVLTEEADMDTVLNGIKKLDIVNSSEVFLMGESQGGLVAAMDAAKRSSEIKGLVLYYPAFMIPDEARTWFGSEDGIPADAAFGNVTVGQKYYQDVINMNVYDEIKGYKGPVLIVHGKLDEVAPISYSEKALDVYRNAKLEVIESAAHGFSGENINRADSLSIVFMRDVLKQ